jgi:U3 small nucleolar RNA-associated protein 19
VFSGSIDHDSKTRFLRLLDLSLRAPTLPSKLVAAYIKRLARLVVSHGVVSSTGDAMYVVGLVVNLIKRHPRCLKLIHRKKTSMSMGIHLSNDPYKETEADPLMSFALKSSLWELDLVMKQHYD